MMISSLQNALIKETIALREPKARKAQGLTLVDGVREVERAMKAGAPLRRLFYCPAICGDVAFKGVESVEVSAKVFEKLAYGQRLDGVIAIAEVRRRHFADLHLSANPLVAVVESIEKPGNLGAILRTCDGAGVEALLICDPKTDLYNPNVIRASVGTVWSVPSATGTNEDVALFLKKRGIRSLGTFVDAKDSYTRADLKGPLAVVLGTEDEGLSPFWRRHCDVKVNIPMKGQADSLNVSVSAAVVIYEALRQRSL